MNGYDSGAIRQSKRLLEDYLQVSGNSESQIENWMGFCLNLDADKDGDLLSVITTDATLLVLQGELVVPQEDE